MTGVDLKNKLESIDMPLRQIAEMVGISEQNLQNKMASADIKVSFLCKLSKILNKSIYFFLKDGEYYQETVVNSVSDNNDALYLRTIIENKDREINELHRQNGRLECKIEYLEDEIKKRRENDAKSAHTRKVANVG